MAGLNDFLTGTSTSATTLPSWYDQAQQNVVSQAQTGAAAMPQLQNTVAGQAIQNLSGSQNPFLTAQNQLQQIGSGAANPWLVDQTTGQVTPNTSTALGGLFQAQNQALNQLLPTTIAPQQAAAVGTGNFGSLRGQTAVDTAKANALANLQAQQMQAALQSQQTGINAATGLSDVGAKGTSTMTTLGQAQQAAPLTSVADLAKILASVNAPASVTQSDQLSPLQQISGLMSGVGALGTGANSLLGTLFPGTSLGSLLNKAVGGLGNVFNSSGDIIDSNIPGSTVDQDSIDAFLSGGAGGATPQELADYAQFFASRGYDVDPSYLDLTGGNVQGGDVEFQ